MTFDERLQTAIHEMFSSVKYKPSALIKMIERHGAVDACKRLISSSQPSDGFTKLYEAGRLDLSVEAIALEPEWAGQFGETERQRCRKRLEQVGYRLEPVITDSRWSKEELRQSLIAYVGMYRNQTQGISFVKSKINEHLREGILSNRTKSSIEFRMQNYSAVFAALGIAYVNGYLPAKNIGANVFKDVVSLLEELQFFETEFFAASIDDFPKKDQALLLKSLATPKGTIKPKRRTQSADVFSRNPSVRQFVLIRANGKCQLCNAETFLTDDEVVFLEVHHLVSLSNGGPDTVENAVAICPNCHRELHFGVHRTEKTENLLQKMKSNI
jgi:5-methylcytosine-specific restriction protein A